MKQIYETPEELVKVIKELDKALVLACVERATISGSAKLFYDHFRAAARARLDSNRDLHQGV